jgi:hypothetical protein
MGGWPEARYICLNPAVLLSYDRPTKWETIQFTIESDSNPITETLRMIGENIDQHPNVRRLAVFDMSTRELSSALASFTDLTSLEVCAQMVHEK